MTNERPKTVDINCTTGEVTERFLTDEEIAESQRAYEIGQANLAAKEAEEAAIAEAKASAEAKLAALGLTAEEIAALSK